MPPSDRKRRMLAKYRRITTDRLTSLTATITTFDPQAASAGDVDSLKRELHTLKGEARLMGLDVICQVAHHLEELFIGAVERGAGLPRSTLVDGLDLVATLVDEPDPFALQPTPETMAFLSHRVGAPSGVPEPVTPKLTSVAPVARTTMSLDPVALNVSSMETASPPGGSVDPNTRRAPTSRGANRTVAPEYLSVDSDQVSAMTQLAGELSIRHEQVDRALSDFERLTRSIAVTLASVTRRERSLLLASDSHTRLAALSRELLATLKRAQNDQFDSRLFLDSMQDEIRKVRMVRVGDLFSRHARALRNLARALGKKVSVSTEGNDITVDKQVLDHLDEPLMHLSRNAIDHGLELPSDRFAAGKPPSGRIHLGAREVGGYVEVFVSDDGRGIDADSIRDRAVERGLPRAAADALSDTDVLSLLFQPGFTTRETPTEISGRGVGLDVVSVQLGEIGGSVQIQSELNAGTSFLMRCPISVAFAAGLVVRAGSSLYAFPSGAVEEVLDYSEPAFEDVEGLRFLRREEERLPVASLNDVLGLPALVPGAKTRVIVLRSGGSLALEVEAVMGEREMVRKSLGRFLAGLPLVSGTATLEGRRLVLFLHVADLFRAAQGLTTTPRRHAHATESIRRTRRVLVVDDSELTREMLTSLLTREGLIVEEAANGAVALETVRSSRPDLVLTDLDMPVLDGLGLIRRLRASPGSSQLPIVVFSTRSTEAGERLAREAGADDYLVKSAFRAGELREIIRRHLPSEPPRPPRVTSRPPPS